MKLKHWGHGPRGLFALVVCLPMIGFGLVSWFGFAVINDLVEVSKKAIVELPAEKGVEIANQLAHVHDRAEFAILGVTAVCCLFLMIFYASALGRFFAVLTGRSYQVIQSHKQMNKLTEKMTQTCDKVEVSSQQTTAAVEQTAAHLEILSSALHKMSVEVEEADKTARAAVEVSERSGNDLNQVIDSLGGLVKQSRKLEEIIGVIESIAFQTNILAVNAAVEAARAGEQGRGFAIVAEAVRNLAQTSASSAKNISAMIRESGETSKRAIDTIRHGTEGLAVTLEHVRRSKKLIGNVAGVNAGLADSLVKMSQSVNQLETTSQFIVGAAEETRRTRTDFAGSLNEFRESSEALGSSLLSLESILEDEAKNTAEKTLLVESAATTFEAKAPVKITSPAKSHSSITSSQTQSEVIRRPAMKSNQVPAASAQKTAPSKANIKSRAREIIPFEGESESETVGDTKLGSISGF